MDPSYNSTHRALLQAFFAHTTLPTAHLPALLSSIHTAADPDRPTLPADITQPDIDASIASVNAAIAPFDYEIRCVHHQSSMSRADSEATYVIVNCTSDPSTQLATRFNADEVKFVRRVLDLMFDKMNFEGREVCAVRPSEALRVAKVRDSVGGTQIETLNGEGVGGGVASSLKLDQAERVLEELKQEGWLELSEAGFLSLSVRALAELGRWLVEVYNDPEAEEDEWQRIKTCEGCKQIVTIVSFHCERREQQQTTPCYDTG
ncbi:hypothetical protein BT63DRAFT_75451 [Microthyrium microscopicum]|uniref:Non-structural maintenance of chromosomes element 1 homolog n=1 Tax=Microthyrium microscopicum TaxID=703497 RepID=A0A6A6U3E5_9PEZI|nr:hypothetical protein BT63DRAFT_75451 [Microthyrium microscopicum]